MSQVNYLSELSGRILETSLDGFFLLDANGVISRANSAYCKMIGYLEQELVGMSITSLEADMTAKEVEMKIESVIKNGSARFETRQKGKNGSIIEIEVSTQLCEIGSDRFFPVFVRDITGHKLAISELHKKQERLSLGEEIANLGYFDRDIKTETHYWSDHAYRILGYEPQEFEGSIEKFMTFVHPDDKERLIRVAGEIVDQRDTKKSDFRIIRKDGIVRKVRTLGKTFFDSDGKAARVVATIQDITEIADYLELLSKSEEMYRNLVLNLPDVAWTIDANGNFIFVSPNVERICGYKPEDYYENDFGTRIEHIHPDDRENIQKAFHGLISRDEPFDVEYRLQKPNGQWVWLHNRSTTTYEKDGIKCADGSFSDITDRKEIENRLQESESKYRMLFERSADATFLVRNGKNIDCNQAALDMMGYTSMEELFGTHPSQLSPEKQPDGRSSFEKANELMSIAVERGSHCFEWNHKRKNGEVFPVEVLLTSIPLAGKEFLYVVLRDITERKKVAIKLSKSEERFRMLSEATFEGIVIHDQGKFIESNQQFHEMFGLSRDEIKGMEGLEIIAPQSRDMVRDHITSGYLDPYEAIGLRKDGTTFPIEIKARQTCLHRQPVRISACRDMTLQKKIEKELIRKEQEIKAVFDSSSDCILVLDEDHNSLYTNQAAFDLVKITRNMMLGKNMSGALAHLPDFMHLWMSRVDKAFATGEPFTVEDTDLIDGRIVHSESVISPIRDNSGNMFAASVVYRDITDRVNLLNELSEYQDRVLKCQRHSYINTLGGMVAHELNQPLTAINLLVGKALYLMKDKEQDCCQFIRHELMKTLDEVKRSIEIIKKFRSLCENTSVGLDKPANVITVGNNIIRSVSKSAERANIKINISSSSEIPEIKINEFVIEQIFLTLIQNAIDASDRTSGHHLQISVRGINEEHVELMFADDCGGIAPANLEKIFQPFFTTKKDGEGMGLGLEIVKEMLITSYGDIRVESEFGKGTTFYLTLPINVET